MTIRAIRVGLALAGSIGVLSACGGSTSGTASCDGGAACAGTGNAGGTGGSGGALTGGSGGVPTGGAGGVGGGGGTPATAHPPPPDPSAPAATGSGPTTLAIYRLTLGDLDSFGTPDPYAWKKLGYDIDGIWSSKTDVNHCKLQEGATKSSIQTDGDGGIDNSFGANFMPIMSSLSSNPSQSVSQAIQAGEFTLLFHLENLAPQPPSQNAIKAALFGGASTPQPPVWSGSDSWPVAADSVNGGNIASPKTAFPSSYLVGGVWVASEPPVPGPVMLRMTMQGFPLVLPIRNLRMSLKVSGSGGSAVGSMGTISGIIDSNELIAELKKVAGAMDANLCEGATFESIAQQVRAASDIMNDGSNGDPTKVCDAISIGIGFDARAVQLGSVASPVPPPPDPCAGF